jgi:hypothetical protein
VFLRTLASYKIPAVIERRRKELLDKLCLLQGDTIREVPPVIVPVEEKSPVAGKAEKVASTEKASDKAPSVEKVNLREKTSRTSKKSSSESSTKDRDDRDDSPASTSSITSPSHGGRLVKRDSKVVTSLVKDYESIHFSAKKEEVDQTPKRLVSLKKVTKPSDFRQSSAGAENEENEEGKVEEKDKDGTAKEGKDKVAEKDEAPKVNGGVTELAAMDSLEVSNLRERASSVASSLDEVGEGEESEKKKKKSKLPFGFKGKKKRDKSPAPERRAEPPPEKSAAEEEPEQQKEEEEEEMQLADGVRICGVLERTKKKGIGGHKKVKIDAKVFHTALVLGGKEELELANCTLEETDLGFDLTHPQHRSPLVFKVDGPEDEKQKWVAILKEVITEATPAKEEGKGRQYSMYTQD